MNRVFLTILVGLCAACSAPRPDQALNEPAVMDLSILPELPLPPGYYLSRADDQVAVALANGAKRYVVLVFLGDAKRTDLMTGDDLADWYDRRLRAYGWQRLDTWRWRHAENQESLRLETGRRENSPTIRFLLRHRSTGMGA